MGTLTFSDLEITLLSSDRAMASGRWKLKQANDLPHGRFTLILKRLLEGVANRARSYVGRCAAEVISQKVRMLKWALFFNFVTLLTF